MKNHFVFPYIGNKRNECDNIYDIVKNNINDIDCIIEPYCGSSAFSYYLSLKHPKKFKYILNDNDDNLIKLYLFLQNNDYLQIINFLEKLDVITSDMDKEKYKKICKLNTLESYIIKNSFYSIHPGLFNDKINKNWIDLINCPIINFLKTENVTILKSDGNDLFNLHKNDNNTLIFLDPPYILSYDEYNKTNIINLYEQFEKYNISDFSSHILMCLGNNYVVRLLFKNHIKSMNEKYYDRTKRITQHVIIYNK